MKPGPAKHEPRLARVAAMVADPARSRMLACLLSGEFATAGELAGVAEVSAATASGHLRRLQDGGLVVCEPRGRHRYYRLADADVAHALEALALVAERNPHDRVWAHPQRQKLRQARCCYGHLAGRLGVALFDTLQAAQALAPLPEGYGLTPHGEAWLETLGMPVPLVNKRRRYAYRCLDWSERRDHLGGQLADALYQHFSARGWVRRGSGRDVAVTPLGQQHLLPRLVKPAGE